MKHASTIMKLQMVLCYKHVTLSDYMKAMDRVIVSLCYDDNKNYVEAVVEVINTGRQNFDYQSFGYACVKHRS